MDSIAADVLAAGTAEFTPFQPATLENETATANAACTKGYREG